MARVVVSGLAQSDSASLLTSLTRDAGHAVAGQYAARFDSLYERLAAHPEIGSPRPALGLRVRIGMVSPYIVVYEHERSESLVTVLRILHGKRRITGEALREP